MRAIPDNAGLHVIRGVVVAARRVWQLARFPAGASVR